MNNNNYTEDHEGILKRAKDIETAWLSKADDAAKAKAVEYPSPHSNPASWDYANGWADAKKTVNISPKCERCGDDSPGYAKSDDITEGCRMNGDGYGSSYATCLTCGMCAWSKWDQA